MANTVQLLVGDHIYNNWLDVSVSASMEAISNSFNLNIVESIPKIPAEARILNGDKCTLILNNEVVVTGYVDDVNKSYNDTSFTIGVTGRDMTGDLVDCSYDGEKFEWNERTLTQIVEDICKPYGIEVLVKTDIGGPFKKFRIEQGEKCIEAIERLCRHRGVLRTSDGQGNLVITRATTERLKTPLVLGENIKSGTNNSSSIERFNQYIVKGQNIGDDNSFGETAAEPFAIAYDKNIRHRTNVILAEEIGDSASYAKRAVWESRIRRAKSLEVIYTVDSWSNNGELWKPNKLVSVTDSLFGISDDMLISAVRYSFNNKGYEATLTMVPPQAFDLLPVAESEDEGSAF